LLVYQLRTQTDLGSHPEVSGLLRELIHLSPGTATTDGQPLIADKGEFQAQIANDGFAHQQRHQGEGK
jgi:hypothetical protein